MNYAVISTDVAKYKTILANIRDEYRTDCLETSSKQIGFLNSSVDTRYVYSLVNKNIISNLFVLANEVDRVRLLNIKAEHSNIRIYFEIESLLDDLKNLVEEKISKSLIKSSVKEKQKEKNVSEVDFLKIFEICLSQKRKSDLSHNKSIKDATKISELEFKIKDNNSEKSLLEKKNNWLRKKNKALHLRSRLEKKEKIRSFKEKIYTEVKMANILYKNNRNRIVFRFFGKKANIKNLDYYLIQESSLFNKDWYLKNYKDVYATGIDPIDHFLRFGKDELRDPSPNFSTKKYINDNKDIKESDINPLVHFLRFGIHESRKFDWKNVC